MSLSGFMKNVSKEASLLKKEITRGAEDLTKTVNKKLDENWSSQLLDTFQTGNVIQLISHSSGKALEIVTAPTGQLVVDGCGQEGPMVYHAHWTVINHGKNQVTLQNASNFLAIVQGTVLLVTSANPAIPGPETYFQLGQKNNYVTLESVTEPGCHLGILSTGEVKSPLATGKESDGQFGVRLIFSPHQQQGNGAVLAQAPPQPVAPPVNAAYPPPTQPIIYSVPPAQITYPPPAGPLPPK